MSDHSQGVLIGTIASIVLTPVVMLIWRRLSPPTAVRPVPPELRERGAALSTESMVATFAILFAWAFIKGFSSEAGPLEAVAAICTVLGFPFVWILFRVRVGNWGPLADFVAYFEAEYRVSFRSASLVSALAALISLICIAVLLFS
jgi:hypothetical protein